ncbi:MAG: SAM-dependent methyltransferase, partial [Enterobacterales bacterium]|nr:SAM-dependent methyltransferase [Enterobacterales bacterium]MDN6651592.1 SAM-dependent methyltransferase [Enterobacterales bacterium]MDN6774465.1 SAM-dependent methyltransferase [Enterobacterales bacterium]
MGYSPCIGERMKPAQITRMISPPLSWSEIPWGEYYRAALEQQLAP